MLQHILTTVGDTVSQSVMDFARSHDYIMRKNDDGCLHSCSGCPSNGANAASRSWARIASRARPSTFSTGSKCTSTQERRIDIQRWSPFTSTVICCFEPYVHPQHPNAHIAVIRVFRSLDADPILPHPSYGGQEYPPGLVPREGELLMELSNGWLRPWFRDVDGKLRKRTKNLFAPLGILFDNAVEYASSYYP